MQTVENILSSPNISNAMLQAVPISHVGLFEGFGGFSIAAKKMGWNTVAWCEWNEFAQKILRYHFPEAEGFGDITTTDFTKYESKIDVLTGGFPCQPFSAAGKRKGDEDERYLWHEMLRAIREVQPSWVVGENVYGLINIKRGLVLKEIKTQLEDAGYKMLPLVILPACGKGAKHRRERVWIIAYSRSKFEHCSFFPEINGVEIQRERNPKEWSENRQFAKMASCIGSFLEKRSDTSCINGILNEFSNRLDTSTISEEEWMRESLKGFGNAIYHDVALEIFKVLETVHRHCL